MDKYLQLLFTEFKNANIIDIKNFKNINYEYKIYGDLLDRKLLPIFFGSDVTITYNLITNQGKYIEIENSYIVSSFKFDDMGVLWKIYADILKENFILDE